MNKSQRAIYDMLKNQARGARVKVILARNAGATALRDLVRRAYRKAKP